MSKTAVPDVYAKVIKEVIEGSRHDFEEGGVDLSALDLLQQGWQKRLSREQIAQFPWDPKPEPVPKIEPSPLPKSVPTLPSNGAALTPPSSSSTPGPHIKQEHYGSQPPMQANYAGQSYNQGPNMSAQQRASMLLDQKFGQNAAAQVAQLQSHQRVPQLSQVPQAQRDPSQHYIKEGLQHPQIKQEFKQEDYTHQNYQQPPGYPPAPLKTSQVDGAADAREQYETEVAHRRALIAEHCGKNDQIIRDHVLASQRSVEGGGLLMALGAQQTGKSQIKAVKVGASGSLRRAQGDAAGDDDEDEDAINSDLDDPDELDENNLNDDELVTNNMLCTYDKVQRVKNKWKCTLKDGMLKVDGAEIVFHKGQGEFEW